jgi:hypothetical protein
MESADLFRRCAGREAESCLSADDLQAARNAAVAKAVVSMEMVAKCLCSITDGDYQDLVSQLGFRYKDR